jgi:hypothetical protein
MSKLIKDPNLVMDYLHKAYVDKDANASEMVKACMQAFALEPIVNKKKRLQIQATGVSTDFQILTKDAFNVTVEEDNFDLGWEQAFRQVTLGRGQDAWEIYNVANGITFLKVEEGQRIQMNKLEGTKVTAYVDYYGAALGWTDKMIRFRKVPAMVDMAMAFRNKFWTNKADNHYSLLAAAASLNTVAYQGVAADGQLQRDIQTINETAFQLGDTNKDKGFGDAANAPFVLYANPRDENRLEAAFRVTSNALATAGQTGVQVTSRRIKRVYTYNSNITSGSPIMIWPGNKLQKADALQPTTYTAPIDPLTLNQHQAVWAIYGAVVADTDQCYQLTLG